MAGTALAYDAAWVLGAVVLLLLLAAIVLAVRRFLIERGGGTVECGLREPGSRSGRGRWRLGVASYQSDELLWYSAFGVSTRPDRMFGRNDLSIKSRRRPDAEETVSLGPDRVIVQCGLPGDQTVELALAETALTGLLAWLEAAPPGSHQGRASLFLPSAAFRRVAPPSAACGKSAESVAI